MKKVTALLLAAAMAFSMAGCSSKEPASDAAAGSENSAAGAENAGTDRKIKDEIVFAQSSDLTDHESIYWNPGARVFLNQSYV